MTGTDDILPRFKPFKYAYEKEIVMYAHMHKLDYFSTECKYAPQAYRGHVRAFIKDLERIRPRTIIGGLLSVRVEFTLFDLDIIASGERMAIRSDVKMPQKSMSSLSNKNIVLILLVYANQMRVSFLSSVQH
ncbi:cytosolic thiouridylase subunit Ctu1, variant 2 [Schistosoma haematobium]|nr:cytosolic thiouridylase subunit Ctu1, variant 2 [Schistosoma haematobium]KAH9596613.1 cytosolic thiouridylase subunit Ctu1, variant 2 [Schistosoma haematobium]